MRHHREFVQDKFKGALVCSCGLAVTYTLLASRPDNALNKMLDELHDGNVTESATRVFDLLFSGMVYAATSPDKQNMADMLNGVFRHSMIERIKAAIKGEIDPLREARK